MEANSIAEGHATRFTTTGGMLYTIWVSTDPADNRACTIRVAPQDAPATADICMDKLTPRENEVARLVVDGWTNLEIADSLCISTSTVKSHIQKIYEKLGVNNRATLTRCCLARSA